jgi:peptide/nickel transport system substrate-binding protein
MLKKRILATVAVIGGVALTSTACGSSSGGSSASGAAQYNAANASIVNASSTVGGTLKLSDSSGFDSLDPGVTYEATSWDLFRMFDRTMLAFKDKPGTAGLQLEGDLATGPATGSSNNTVWTYHIQPNAKFSDGTTITSADIKYAIERSNFDSTATVHGGPSYFASLLQNSTNYTGPFKDKNASDGVSGIETPNATTITFKLNQPFADFNYLMTLLQTSPIERSKEQGSSYGTNISGDSFTGQYEVQSYKPGSSLVLVPNPDFDSSSDPNKVHVRYASKVVLSLGVDASTIDQDLLQGSTGLDVRGIGVSSSTQAQVLGNPKQKANADDATTGFQTFMSVNTTVAPLTNLACRQAIEWAVNKQQVQDVSGGSVGGGTIATTVLPTNNTAYVAQDQYATGGHEGDAAKAKALVSTCKSELGSSFNPSFALATYNTSDNKKMIAAADVIQQNLDAIGFNVTINQYSYGTGAFFTSDAGLPSFASSHRIGLSLWAWGADFPTGYGYMDMILTKDGISSAGSSYDMSYWDSSTFDGYMKAALSATSTTETNADYAKADQYAMSQAVIVPLLDQTDLLYRPTDTTNVTVSQAYGMYDYNIIGTTASN